MPIACRVVGEVAGLQGKRRHRLGDVRERPWACAAHRGLRFDSLGLRGQFLAGLKCRKLLLLLLQLLWSPIALAFLSQQLLLVLACGQLLLEALDAFAFLGQQLLIVLARSQLLLESFAAFAFLSQQLLIVLARA